MNDDVVNASDALKNLSRDFGNAISECEELELDLQYQLEELRKYRKSLTALRPVIDNFAELVR